ncbi:aconitase X [Chloroflexota bacterium]
MYLTREENEMLEGKHGFPKQKCMEILVGLGDCYDAERMIPVNSAHLVYNSTSLGKGGMIFFREMADQGVRFVINATTNPLSFNLEIWENCGFQQQLREDQEAVSATFAQMGALLSNTCTPYSVGCVPRMRQHIAWNESSAISFANSVLGARTNREGGPSAFAAAVTGKTPEYGLHLDRYRFGELKIVVTAKLKSVRDYGTLGYFIGKIAQDKVPVCTGIPPSVSWDELKLLGTAAAVSGSVALYHVVGVTPEAPDEAVAFGGAKCKDWQTIKFGEKELRDTEESLSSPLKEMVDVVAIGCPHASITELRDIANTFAGKSLRPDVEFWIETSHMVKAYAQAMGYVDAIEVSGARVLSGACPMTIMREILKDGRPRTIATDSPKLANGLGVYDATGGRVAVYYLPLATCVELATRAGGTRDDG